MNRQCNLCGKKSVVGTRHLIHGNNRFQLCRRCANRIQWLHNQEHYQAAREYIENKMKLGQNERMNYILRSKIQNAFEWTLTNQKEQEEEETEKSVIPALIQSIGVLGGGALFLLGICMLNIHLELAIALIISAVLLGGILYGTGIFIEIILLHLGHK